MTNSQTSNNGPAADPYAGLTAELKRMTVEFQTNIQEQARQMAVSAAASLNQQGIAAVTPPAQQAAVQPPVDPNIFADQALFVAMRMNPGFGQHLMTQMADRLNKPDLNETELFAAIRSNPDVRSGVSALLRNCLAQTSPATPAPRVPGGPLAAPLRG